jgi:hypothetical protein
LAISKLCNWLSLSVYKVKFDASCELTNALSGMCGVSSLFMLNSEDAIKRLDDNSALPQLHSMLHAYVVSSVAVPKEMQPQSRTNDTST